MQYKKKFFFVLLSTLLLTLLLGCFMTSYAVELGQVKNIVYNAMTEWNGVTDEEARLKITNYPYWDNVEVYCNSAYYLVAFNTSINYFNFCFVPTTQTTSFRNYTSNGVVVTDLYSKKYAMLVLNQGTFNSNITTWANGSNISGQRIKDCIYVGSDVYSYNTTDKLYYDEYYSPSWFNLTGDYYNTIIWEYIPNDEGTATITQTGMSGGGGNYHLTSGVLKDNLGLIRDAEYIDHIYIHVYAYNKIQNAYTNKIRTIDYYDYKKDGYIWEKYPGTTSNSNGVYAHTLMLDTNQYFDCVLQFNVISYDTSLSEFVFWYYVKSDYTHIVNGSIIAIDTFSGDYNIDYNNQTDSVVSQNQTDDIVDTLTDDSEVDNQLNDFFSSGDLLNDIGYSPLENPFTSVILDIATSISDALLDNQNETLTIGYRDFTATLHSEDFTLPNNSFTTLLHLFFNGLFIYAIYHYGFELFQWINQGKVDNLLNEANRKQYYLF